MKLVTGMFDWNQESVRDLKRLVADGRSGGEISRTFGTTRNTIIGKAHRLGLKFNPANEPMAYRGMRPQAGPTTRPRHRKPGKLTPAPVSFVTPKPAVPKPRRETKRTKDAPLAMAPCTIVELTAERCHWPLWNDDGSGARLYCGGVAIENDKLPYCAHHTRVALGKETTS
jgi:GcrA cell cycle regulator